MCCICRYGLHVDQALFHQLNWYLVRCPAYAIVLHIAQLLCYCEKDNLCSLLESVRQAEFSLVEINSAKVHESSPEFGGGVWAPFLNSGWYSSLGQTATPGTTCPTLFNKCVGSLMSPANNGTLKMQGRDPTV